MSSEPPDLELLTQWRAGQANAGKQLVERYFPVLYRFFWNKASEAVDDLVQETFLACVKTRDTFRGDASFRTYILRVARNILYKHIDQNRRKGVEEYNSKQVHPSFRRPSSLMANAEERSLVLLALRHLPEELQAIIELHYWESLSSREIGDILELPPGTVRSRLRRAKEQLRLKIESLAGSPASARSTLGNLEHWIRNSLESPNSGPKG